MKSQYHINTPQEPKWYRCKRVEFIGETATWELSMAGEYGLLEAYQKAPHRQLIQATDDALLKSFVKAWGPLRMTLGAWNGSDPIAVYRRERDGLRASVLLLAAIQNGEGLREAAIDLLKVDSEPFGIHIRELLGIPQELKPSLGEAALNRVGKTTNAEILKVCDFLVGSFPVPAPSFEIQRKGKATTLRPTLGIYSILGALRWMVWQDIFIEKPFRICADLNCGRFINFTSKHDRKFCTEECAHRVAARESAKRKREEKKNGTQKAR